MQKNYDHNGSEDTIYAAWEKAGVMTADAWDLVIVANCDSTSCAGISRLPVSRRIHARCL